MARLAVKTETKTAKPPKAEEKKTGFIKLPLTSLIKASWNYKLDDEEKATKLTENIRRNGQLENLIVRDLGNGTFEIANGNHRFDAFQKVGVEEVVCYNLGRVSQKKAERIAIETNETRFENDAFKLAEIATGLLEEFDQEDLLATLVYTGDEFDAMLKMIDYDGTGSFEGKTPEVKVESSEFLKDSIPIIKILQSLNITTMTSDQNEAFVAAVFKERERCGVPLSHKDNSATLASIIDFYLKNVNGKGKSK